MAVITLHRPGTGVRDDTRTGTVVTGDIHRGNYLDLSTGQAHIFQATDAVKAAQEFHDASAQLNAPQGALIANLAGDAADAGAAVNVSLAVIEDAADPDLNWAQSRLFFDRMTYENVGDDRAVTALTYEDVNLADPKQALTAGARAVIRFDGHDGTKRYFRFLLHTAIDEQGIALRDGFASTSAALQFEELVPGRIIVPLGIRQVENGYAIVTSEQIPAHRVSKQVSSLMWSIRPSMRAYVGADLYDRAFPIATVIFRINLPAQDKRPAHTHHFRNHAPPWVGSVTQRCLTSRSYLNSTYCIAVNRRGCNHSDYLVYENPADEKRPPQEPGTVRYWYNLVMVDGAAMEFEDYDPPVDVEDEQ